MLEFAWYKINIARGYINVKTDTKHNSVMANFTWVSLMMFDSRLDKIFGKDVFRTLRNVYYKIFRENSINSSW